MHGIFFSQTGCQSMFNCQKITQILSTAMFVHLTLTEINFPIAKYLGIKASEIQRVKRFSKPRFWASRYQCCRASRFQ
jgi:hypothetical protein